MACAISCSISLIFIIGMIYFYYMTDKSEIVKEYKSKLPTDLQKKYEKISQERMILSYYGYFYGFIISLFLIFYNIKIKKEKVSTWAIVCLVMASCFLTNYFYYRLTPKSDWMLNHINNAEQAKLWLQMYKTMSVYYHTGLVLGIIAVGILAFAFRC